MDNTRTFGAEIEFVGTTREAAAAALVAAGIDARVVGYGHGVTTYWRLVTDSSVQCHDSHYNGGELVSPILRGEEGLALIMRACAALAGAGATVNASCGLHIHVGADDLSVADVRNVVARYAGFQSEINRFMPRARHHSSYTKPVADTLAMLQGRAYADTAALKSACTYWDRFVHVNLVAFAKYGTVEFRQHSGTVNGSKIATWIRFCVAFVGASKVASVSVAAATPATAPRTGVRGRRPNYAARQTLVRLMDDSWGVSVATLARETGFAEGSIIGSFFGQLRGMGRVTHRDGYYRFVPTNHAALSAWLGETATPAPRVAPAPAPRVTSDNLFAGMEPDIRSFYRERAMELAQG